MCAACLSALPAVQCRSLAIAYMWAIIGFGFAGIAGVSIVFCGGIPSQDTPRERKSDRLFVIIFLAFGLLGFAGGAFSAVPLISAVNECWPLPKPPSPAKP